MIFSSAKMNLSIAEMVLSVAEIVFLSRKMIWPVGKVAFHTRTADFYFLKTKKA